MWQSGDKAMVLCFVEFADTRCALSALEALQGLVLLLNLCISIVLCVYFLEDTSSCFLHFYFFVNRIYSSIENFIYCSLRGEHDLTLTVTCWSIYLL